MTRRSLLIVLLLLQACGGGRLVALPEDADQSDRDRRVISRRIEDLSVTVETDAWRARPRRLTDDLLPFLVRIANHTRGEVTLRLAELSLIDDSGRSHSPLRPAEVVSLLLGDSDLQDVVPSIQIEASGPEPTIFGLELGVNFNLDRDLRDIRGLAFPPEPLPPGSSAEGFIYFPRPLPGARRLTVILALDAPSGRLQLPFSYAIEK